MDFTVMGVALAQHSVAAYRLHTATERACLVADAVGVAHEQMSAVGGDDLCFEFQTERSSGRRWQGPECSLC